MLSAKEILESLATKPELGVVEMAATVERRLIIHAEPNQPIFSFYSLSMIIVDNKETDAL